MILFLFSLLTSVLVAQTAYDFSFNGLDGKPEIDLSNYKNNIILVVNTASKCGFTGQYEGLETLHRTYADQGLVIIGVPSRDFASQEFAEACDVDAFTKNKYDITFLLADITHVKGDDAHPFYQWAKSEAGFMGGPKWNFHKYLIGKDGNLIDSFGSRVKPESKKLVTAIESQL